MFDHSDQDSLDHISIQIGNVLRCLDKLCKSMHLHGKHSNSFCISMYHSELFLEGGGVSLLD